MDVQKTMEFILEQQAALTAGLQELRISVQDLRIAVTQHERDLETHSEWKVGMSQALQELAGHMKTGFDELTKRQSELTIAQRQLTVAQRQLADAQKETRDDLNLLITTVQEILPRLPKQ